MNWAFYFSESNHANTVTLSGITPSDARAALKSLQKSNLGFEKLFFADKHWTSSILDYFRGLSEVK
jgi:hypothetical protein